MRGDPYVPENEHDSADALQEPRIPDRSLRGLTLHPRVVAARGDPEHPTQRPIGILAVRPHESEFWRTESVS